MFQDQRQDIPIIITEKKHQDQEHNKGDKVNNQKAKKVRQSRKQGDVITEIKEVPVTVERKIPRNLSESLGNAGMPRANIAASKEVPKGTLERPKNKTVLQQHVEFFDTDNDNIIYPLDTFKGLRKLGFNLGFSALSTGIIHMGLSYPTQPSWIPDPLLKIHVNKIHRAKHGSDSETYDTEGRFVPEKFEEIFSKYDRENKGGLNMNDIKSLIRGDSNAFDPFGWAATAIEWGTLYLLCAKDGIISKEDVRTCYDGTLFHRMAETEEKRQKGVGLDSIIKGLKTELKEE